ncbi:MAG TPA: trans-aconitate 2-methyltransferase [Planctomycetaceae bacterium]|jgi:trans-aconitate 2-methyltransferase
MPDWDADQYLRFAEERTRPCRDLVARIAIPSSRRVIDLGCGPGNSTQVLAERWPEAALTGLDSSIEMIAAARRAAPIRNWLVADISTWTASNSGLWDVVFSNAALQWVPDHPRLFPQLLTLVAPGGALAVQVPNNIDAPAHVAARSVAASSAWRSRFPAGGVREWHVHDAGFYYDLLAPRAARIDLWETEYLHILPGPEAIVEWYKGTGLRPFLEVLSSPEERQDFVAAYLEAIRDAYPARADGHVLFPFRRLFLIAYRG